MKLFRRRIVFYSYVTLAVFLFEIVFPAAAHALTGGPSTPEVQSFEPIGTSDMVDLFTGDFKYNIPLMEVDGYPVNISYNGGINVDQEASWVGLGWNLNPGTVTRNVRGIPDDFKGDEIRKEIKMKDNVTVGLSNTKSLEIVGKTFTKTGNNTAGKEESTGSIHITPSLKLGFLYNNYDGTGIDVGTGINASLLNVTGSSFSSGVNFGYTGASGVTLSKNASFDYKIKFAEEKIAGQGSTGISTSQSVNSRAGMQQLNFGWNLSGMLQLNNSVDNMVLSGNAGHNSAIILGSQTYTPAIGTPTSNISIGLNFNFGKEFKALTFNQRADGFVSVQRIRDNGISKKAYGYRHLEDADGEDMMDFNREKDVPFSENTQNLAIPVATYDIFSVSGHGAGGTYRLYRNDNIYYREDTLKSYSAQDARGVDLGTLDKFKWGLNLSFVLTKSNSGNIHNGNLLRERAGYLGKDQIPLRPEYEPAYFRAMGEPVISNSENQSSLMGLSLLEPSAGIDYVGPDYIVHTGNTEPNSSKIFKRLGPSSVVNAQLDRMPRNSVMQGLNAYQANRFGLDTKIRYYSSGSYVPSGGLLSPDVEEDRITGQRKEHHLSEIRIHSVDGTRYIYGLPAYNVHQEEISFATGISSAASGDCATGLVSYGSQDISASRQGGNTKGKDHFVQKITTPAYVYAHHLTGIVSPDYVDLTGDGISDDDLGTSIRFDYQKLATNYHWRTPFQSYKAMYNEGRKTDFSDDRGSILYGEKEVYYLHSIVGKNHIAVFYLSNRNDGLGVADVNGSASLTFLQKLDSIVLYNKQDFYQNGPDAYRIKGVHFVYDYTLCENVENFYGPGATELNYAGDPFDYKGKLTLKKIYFTYGNSFKGKLSPYTFNYSQEDQADHFAYHIKAHDRWGTYQRGTGETCGSSTGLTSAEYPYTTQNQAQADTFAAVWSLSEIILPSGGKIAIELEADDYGYVQDRRAMTMMDIEGFNDDTAYAGISDLLYTKAGDDDYHNYVFFSLNGQTSQQELDRMIQGMQQIQFTVFADIDGKGNYEFVRGYADIDWNFPTAYGLTNGGNSAYIRLKTVKNRDNNKGKDVNPVSMNIWNWSRIYAADLVHNQRVSSDVNSNKAFKGVLEIFGMFNELLSMVQGINGNLKTRGFGQKVNVNKSYLRIQAKNTRKLGGGHRVKSIKINDHWAYMGSANTSAGDSEYGQEYTYTTTEKDSEGNVLEISSGVASYEPGIGADENPFHQPRYNRKELALVPDIMYMDDAPVGESFMPAPVVGYSHVTVKALSHTGVGKTATGRQEFEFFTARDFPVRVHETAPKVVPIRPSFLDQLFNFDHREETFVMASQGYKIEVNDMHGKPRAQYTYAETGEKPIGGVVYEYFKDTGEVEVLNNRVKVVSMDGTIQEKEMATEVEVQSDYRQSFNEVKSAAINLNADFFTVASWPLLIPSLYNGYRYSSQKVQTVVTTKVVSRYGILKSTTAIKEGSEITTENLLFDEVTGSVLVSRVQNEFDDDLYSMTTPAHWAYDEGMGPAYKNTGLVVKPVTLTGDSILFPGGLNVRDYLVPGDEVLVKRLNNGNTYRCHVYEGADYKLNLIDEKSGQVFYQTGGGFYSIEVIRSGRRNMAAVPIQQMSMIVNPINGSSLTLDSVYSASAVTYDQYWPFYCNKYYKTECDTAEYLPLDEIADFLDDVFGNFEVSNSGFDVDGACVLERLSGYGYLESSLDSLFIKEIDGGDEVFTLLDPDASCIHCYDSLFIKLAEGTYKGFYGNDLIQCRDESVLLSCNSGLTAVMGSVPYAALYERYRYSFDSLRTECTEGDTSLSVDMRSGSTYQGNGFVEFLFNSCQDECAIRIEIPDGFCYRQLVSVLDITYESNTQFAIDLLVKRPDKTFDTLSTTGEADCLGLRKINCVTTCEVPDTSIVLNPYYYGILGNWRMKRQFAYVDNRNYESSPRPRKDGTIGGFAPYWSYNMSQGKHTASSSTKWVWANQVTKYSPHGNELENQDALGRYSAALFGFNYTLPVAVAGNSKYEQLAYEGFEENNLFWESVFCYQGHFGFDGYIVTEAVPTTQYAHSGRYSLHVKPGQSVSSSNDRSSCSEAASPFGSTQYNWRNCYCVGQFNPDTGRYILSGWIKEGVNLLDTTYANATIQVKLHKTGSVVETYNFKGQGQIIDGWQRAFGEFRVSDSVEQVEVVLLGVSDIDCWFDDIRIHPFNSNMKTYAYDQITLRLLAELDENNFATFYEYDQEGALIRVKKETERGISTLKEIRKSMLKTSWP